MRDVYGQNLRDYLFTRMTLLFLVPESDYELRKKAKINTIEKNIKQKFTFQLKMPIQIFNVNHRTSNSMFKDGSSRKNRTSTIIYMYIQEGSLKHIVTQ